jgi:hypothetical protein
MQKFIETIIHAVKSWVKNDAFTADDAFEMAIEMDIIKPLVAVDGTIYTSPEGEIYTIG